ncbi:MAG: hypothetical protein JKY57_04755 [Kordiimonadaceae bacterium]|nr:hypothetical protein [Kordiimonadaceae bacterium]
MPDTGNNDKLEAARTRLETALSTLSHGVASTRSTLDAAATIAEEKAAMATRINVLEQENLKLHEQVATLALQPAAQDTRGQVEILTQEKATLSQEVQQLKNSYAALQDETQNAPVGEAGTHNTSDMEAANAYLKAENATMQQEKAMMRAELDKTIAELETLLENA